MQELQRPTVMAAEVLRFVWLLQSLAPAVRLDLSGVAAEVLMSATHSQLKSAEELGGVLLCLLYAAAGCCLLQWQIFMCYCLHDCLANKKSGMLASLLPGSAGSSKPPFPSQALPLHTDEAAEGLAGQQQEEDQQAPRLISQIAGWYVQVLLRDARKFDVATSIPRWVIDLGPRAQALPLFGLPGHGCAGWPALEGLP